MYKIDSIETGFLHLIGVKQYHDPQILTIADSLLESESGLFLQQSHPLMTLDNIYSVAPDFDNIAYDTWNDPESVLYRQYDRVTYDDVNYRALRDNQDKQPDISPDDWERFNEFDEWLENNIKNSIGNTIRKFLNEKKVIKTARSIFENKALFNGAGSLTDLITNSGNWVGFELVPKRYNGISIDIKRVGFQSSKAETFNLYLFHSSKNGYVKKQEITISEAKSFEWVNLSEWYLPYIDDNNAGGSWYVVYNQNELSGKAINTVRDWSQKPCNCSRANLNLYNLWSEFLTITPFKAGFVDENIWDIENNIYLTETNFGLNLELSVYCDYTKTLVDQRDLFKDIIFYGLAMDFLRIMAYNPNANIDRHVRNALPSAERILYEIDGDSRGREGGLKKDFRLAMDAIKLDFEGLSKYCFPCRKTGVKYKVIG